MKFHQIFIEELFLNHVKLWKIYAVKTSIGWFLLNLTYIFCGSDTKIDPSFPSVQFHLKGYATPYRSDRYANGGGILLYIREDIPSKLLNTGLSTAGFFVEMRLREKTWLFCSSYNPKKNLIATHLNSIGRNLDSQLGQY